MVIIDPSLAPHVLKMASLVYISICFIHFTYIPPSFSFIFVLLLLLFRLLLLLTFFLHHHLEVGLQHVPASLPCSLETYPPDPASKCVMTGHWAHWLPYGRTGGRAGGLSSTLAKNVPLHQHAQNVWAVLLTYATIRSALLAIRNASSYSGSPAFETRPGNWISCPKIYVPVRTVP